MNKKPVYPTKVLGRKSEEKSVQGYYLGVKLVGEQKYVLHVFQTKNGPLGVWGASDLNQKMKGVPLRAMTRVTFVKRVAVTPIGIEDSDAAGLFMNKYDVMYDTEDFLPKEKPSHRRVIASLRRAVNALTAAVEKLEKKL